jgi:hemolysin activation/secretion protein
MIIEAGVATGSADSDIPVQRQYRIQQRVFLVTYTCPCSLSQTKQQQQQQEQQQQQQRQQEQQQEQQDQAAAAAAEPMPPASAAYGDDRCGFGSRDDPLALPSPAEVEAALLQLPQGADKGAASKQQLAAWNERFKGVAAAAAGLEQLASAATTQYMDAQGRRCCRWPTAW